MWVASSSLRFCGQYGERRVVHNLPMVFGYKQVDSGMGRLGVPLTDAPALVSALKASPHFDLEGIMTHYSRADDDAEFTGKQVWQRMPQIYTLMPLLWGRWNWGELRGGRGRSRHDTVRVALACRPERSVRW